VDLQLTDKVAVVTGASKGIGLAFLASGRAGNITGVNYVIDGGLIKTT
jgi:NADP-dependent 3-hydroxy acid dehydrogenase YdfG